MQTDEFVSLIDGALERFAARDLVSGSEVLDLLLDMRIAALRVDEELRQLIEAEQASSTAG
jgi:hypothetical protein